MNDLLTRARGLLQGEPLRAIVYGAAVVVWITTHALQAVAIGHIEVVSFDQALVVATGAAALLTELSRRYVYSPATTARVAAAAIDAAVGQAIPADAPVVPVPTASSWPPLADATADGIPAVVPASTEPDPAPDSSDG